MGAMTPPPARGVPGMYAAINRMRAPAPPGGMAPAGPGMGPRPGMGASPQGGAPIAQAAQQFETALEDVLRSNTPLDPQTNQIMKLIVALIVKLAQREQQAQGGAGAPSASPVGSGNQPPVGAPPPTS